MWHPTRTHLYTNGICPHCKTLSLLSALPASSRHATRNASAAALSGSVAAPSNPIPGREAPQAMSCAQGPRRRRGSPDAAGGQSQRAVCGAWCRKAARKTLLRQTVTMPHALSLGCMRRSKGLSCSARPKPLEQSLPVRSPLASG